MYIYKMQNKFVIKIFHPWNLDEDYSSLKGP